MNAYELADELDNWKYDIPRNIHLKLSNMLRQQADRIAELEKGGEVAGRFYWESVVDGHVMAVPSEGTPHYNKDDFPLYTAPRELSDEEILKVAANKFLTSEHRLVLLFARDLLRKAQEK